MSTQVADLQQGLQQLIKAAKNEEPFCSNDLTAAIETAESALHISNLPQQPSQEVELREAVKNLREALKMILEDPQVLIAGRMAYDIESSVVNKDLIRADGPIRAAADKYKTFLELSK